MASALQRLFGAVSVIRPWEIQVFGVRHLSPGGAWHLRRFLDRHRPEWILVEGLADASDLTQYWTQRGTKPPIAVLAYTLDLPIRTLVYPLARYSPEFQAVLWAHENQVPVEFCDLPSDIFLGLQDQEFKQREKVLREEANVEDRNGSACDGDSSLAPPAAPSRQTSGDDDDQALERRKSNGSILQDDARQSHRSLYEEIARRCGERDYDAYWERNFEHNLNDDAYRRAAIELGRWLRELEHDSPTQRAESLVREAFMRRCIEQVIARGVPPSKIVAVVGAFHAPVLTSELPALTDDELASLPRRPSSLTLMPYSYFRLSTQSGYGAGNAAPAYFELMWESLLNNDLSSLAGRYLSLLTRDVREFGTHRSTAEVIEGVRLARTLSAMHAGSAPTLSDLHDAAITLIGHGDRSAIAEAIARVDVGTAIGELPAGVSRTSIQEDFDRLLVQLKLERFRSPVKRDLALDLRENRQAKTESAAFLDLHRSAFLHRLRVLGVTFAEHIPTRQESGTWSEHWKLQWTPESEITLVEAVLLGETVELAIAYKLKQSIESARSIDEASRLVHDSCLCHLPELMEHARARLQELATASSAMPQIAQAAFQLMHVVRFGDVRKFDPAPLMPLIEELFVQGVLALHEAAHCDDAAARQLVESIEQMNRVSLDFHERMDESLWQRRLQALADADDRNPLLSGVACAILLERGWMSNDTLAREVSRRLSPGIAADLGAGWFEGLASRNRYSLIARQVLWEKLGDYVNRLDEEQFRRALVFLRRAFGTFSPNEKRSIAENLAHTWGVDAEQTVEALEGQLSDAEEQALEELNELDFNDL